MDNDKINKINKMLLNKCDDIFYDIGFMDKDELLDTLYFLVDNDKYFESDCEEFMSILFYENEDNISKDEIRKLVENDDELDMDSTLNFDNIDDAISFVENDLFDEDNFMVGFNEITENILESIRLKDYICSNEMKEFKYDIVKLMRDNLLDNQNDKYIKYMYKDINKLSFNETINMFDNNINFSLLLITNYTDMLYESVEEQINNYVFINENYISLSQILRDYLINIYNEYISYGYDNNSIIGIIYEYLFNNKSLTNYDNKTFNYNHKITKDIIKRIIICDYYKLLIYNNCNIDIDFHDSILKFNNKEEFAKMLCGFIDYNNGFIDNDKGKIYDNIDINKEKALKKINPIYVLDKLYKF